MELEPGPLETSVRAALAELELKPTDGGIAELAATYAREIDRGAELDKVGPLLLAALDALLMTPKARAVATKGAPGVGSPAVNPLDELRARREQRTG
jgi:hypothetical protein